MTPEQLVVLVEKLVADVEALKGDTALLAEAQAVETAVKAMLSDGLVQGAIKGAKQDFLKLKAALAKLKV